MDVIAHRASSSVSRRQELAKRIIVPAILLAAIAMRLYGLNTRFNSGGYDEGVYWETLRAVSAGNGLYGQTFFSQTPFFLQSIDPFYALLGSTIFAARLGVAALSLLGLAGVYLLGRALAGRAGGIAALVIVLVTPLYLGASQRLQAEGPATAFLFLTVGAAFLWWEHPTGGKGLALAIACGSTLSLGTLIKLLDVTAVFPILLLVFVRLWQVRQQVRSHITAVLVPIAAGIATTIITALIVLLPFLGSLHALLRQVVTFHIAARAAMLGSRADNILVLYQFFAANALLAAAAIAGAIVATLRRDWRVIPLIVWLLVTLVGLIMHVPLFAHHTIVLIPPLVALVALGLHKLPAAEGMRHILHGHNPARSGALLVGLLALAAVLASIPSDYRYYRELRAQAASSETQRAARIAADLEQITTPEQWIIADDQFVAGLAGRDTPPWLVDTSMVRVRSGYLTTPDLIRAASDPRVHAVLFATNRLLLAPVGGFHDWVAQRFRRFRTYGPGIELWIR